jgi:hypothetical protein
MTNSPELVLADVSNLVMTRCIQWRGKSISPGTAGMILAVQVSSYRDEDLYPGISPSLAYKLLSPGKTALR